MKKSLRVLIVAILVLTLTCGSALACENYIQKRQNNALYAMVRTANAQVKALVRIAQITPYDDIDWLQYSVGVVTRPVFAYARMIGAEVLCTYKTYYIDGQYVEVDPLKVINVIDG